MTVLVCYCTCPDHASAERIAERIAERLVDERLAACVNLVPAVRSLYRWQGRLERADEVLLVIKTTQARLDALAGRIAELHPYELPELIAVEAAGGSAAYLAWVDAETRPGAP